MPLIEGTRPKNYSKWLGDNLLDVAEYVVGLGKIKPIYLVNEIKATSNEVAILSVVLPFIHTLHGHNIRLLNENATLKRELSSLKDPQIRVTHNLKIKAILSLVGSLILMNKVPFILQRTDLTDEVRELLKQTNLAGGLDEVEEKVYDLLGQY